jgi:hypothetical protein
LLDICSTCFIEYGVNGAVGYKYESVKDSLLWCDYSIKDNIATIMRIGSYVALSNEDYKKAIEDEVFNELDKSDIEKVFEEFKNG